MNDEVLIHPKDWPEPLRYATHARQDSWRPPLVSLETSKLLNLAHDLTPGAFALYVALVAMYADAPLLWPGGLGLGIKGDRKLPLRKAYGLATAAGWTRNVRWTPALKSLEQAGLIAFSTVDGRSVDGLYLDLVKGRTGRGLELVTDQDSKDSAPEFLDPAETIRA